MRCIDAQLVARYLRSYAEADWRVAGKMTWVMQRTTVSAA